LITHHKNLLIQGSISRPMATDVMFEANGIHKPVVVYIHGFNGFKDWGNFDLVASEFAQAGYFFIKSNLSHNGTTPSHPSDFVDLEAYGQNNYSKEIYDTNAIIDWVLNIDNVYKNEFDTSKISLLGHSRGGGISFLTAAQNKSVKAIITWASIAECKTPWGNWSDEKLTEWKENGVQYYSNKRTNQEMPLLYQLYEDYINHRQELDIQQAISNLQIPILLCHGTNDEAVPYKKAIQLKAWQPSATLFTLESDHVFGRKHPWDSISLPEATQQAISESISFLNSTFL
jgi:dienelactone hydrolase